METCCIDSKLVIEELFSSFDEQPMEHQIELIDALGDFRDNWMVKHGLNSFTVQDKQWKSQISAITISQDHDCNINSLFTNSKLLQRLICMGLRKMLHEGSNELQFKDHNIYPSLSVDQVEEDADTTSNEAEHSAHSSDTEAMEYEELDRYLFSIDSAALAKDMMEPPEDAGKQMAFANRTDPVDQPQLKIEDNYPPSPSYPQSEDVIQPPAVRVKRKYTKRKKRNGVDGFLEKSKAKGQSKKRRVVQVIAPAMPDPNNSQPDMIRDTDGVMKFKCCVCGILFTRIWHLRRHVRLHYGVKPHVCCMCPKAFARAEHLRKHMSRHAGGRTYKPHTCRHCGLEFSVGRELKEHMKEQHVTVGDSTPASVRPKHQCTVCSRMCPDAGQLRVHMRMHTGDKPFMCAECGRLFTRHGHLRRHMRLHTGDKPFMCNKCACQFARADHLRRHLLAHHSEDNPSKQPATAMEDRSKISIKTDADSQPDDSDGVAPLASEDIPVANSEQDEMMGSSVAQLCGTTDNSPGDSSTSGKCSDIVPHLAGQLTSKKERLTPVDATVTKKSPSHVTKNLLNNSGSSKIHTDNRHKSKHDRRDSYDQMMGLDYRRRSESVGDSFVPVCLDFRQSELPVASGNFEPPGLTLRYGHSLAQPVVGSDLDGTAVDFRRVSAADHVSAHTYEPSDSFGMASISRWGNVHSPAAGISNRTRDVGCALIDSFIHDDLKRDFHKALPY